MPAGAPPSDSVKTDIERERAVLYAHKATLSDCFLFPAQDGVQSLYVCSDSCV